MKRLLLFAVTADAGKPLDSASQNAAASGCVVARSLNPARTLLPAQYGHPSPLDLYDTLASHSWPQGPSHQ